MIGNLIPVPDQPIEENYKTLENVINGIEEALITRDFSYRET